MKECRTHGNWVYVTGTYSVLNTVKNCQLSSNLKNYLGNAFFRYNSSEEYSTSTHLTPPETSNFEEVKI